MLGKRCSVFHEYYICPVSYTHLDVYKRQRRHDARGKWVKYNIGQMVLAKRHDLLSAQDKEIKMQNSYVLQNNVTGEIVGTHNATNLKLYWSS